MLVDSLHGKKREGTWSAGGLAAMGRGGSTTVDHSDERATAYDHDFLQVEALGGGCGTDRRALLCFHVLVRLSVGGE